MVGDFMVCVDRIVASTACFDSGNGARDGLLRREEEEEGSSEIKRRESDGGFNNGESLKKMKKKEEGLIECRICQEEGEEAEMEAPCVCTGMMKFAHRKCIQRWCNKKGDITCEICNQVYAPNYFAPQPRLSSDVIAIDIRQGWGTRIDLHDSHLLAIAAAEQELLNAEYEEYAAVHNNGIACCRSVALILMLLLLVRHVLMVIRDAGMVQDASDFFNLSLQFAGFLLPCYLIIQSCYVLQSRRRRQV
ncbi:uncharacterized protein LOC109837615 [Asparagus officinalis]|uniref:uncharacterized protein LOC109837615 n=1 Tax=Asparagus officinalis TaxID=4686 RepID=UPI00098E0DD0|nr:uncharacterized protein LOC109837615 [Asparagus officinalis]